MHIKPTELAECHRTRLFMKLSISNIHIDMVCVVHQYKGFKHGNMFVTPLWGAKKQLFDKVNYAHR